MDFLVQFSSHPPRRDNSVTNISCLGTCKGTQAWDNFEFFLPQSNPYMPLVNFWNKFRFFSFDFRQNFEVQTFFGGWAYAEQNILERYPNIFFFQNVHLGPIRWVPKRFFKIWIFYRRNLHFKFWVIFENYSTHMLSICRKEFYRTLSIQGNDFIAHWAYAKQIFTYA